MQTFVLSTLLVLVTWTTFSANVQCWDNGLARLPPMGWISWVKYECNVDCVNYPNDCINEKLYKDMVDNIIDQGYSALGYNNVNIDDCWAEKERDNHTKRMVPDKKRFPNGIHSLVKYAHSKGVKLGIYTDIGTKTCAGYPATRGDHQEDYTQVDAQTFGEWEIDSLKVDACYQDWKMFNTSYPEYSKALEKYGINFQL